MVLHHVRDEADKPEDRPMRAEVMYVANNLNEKKGPLYTKYYSPWMCLGRHV